GATSGGGPAAASRIEPLVRALPLLRTVSHENRSTLVASEAGEPRADPRRQRRRPCVWLFAQHRAQMAASLPAGQAFLAGRTFPPSPSLSPPDSIQPGRRRGALAPSDRLRRRAAENGVRLALQRRCDPPLGARSRPGPGSAQETPTQEAPA